ncbi:hypothetical protein BN440_2995 [Erwinia amylovora MR1]|nr:hypothetical protein BN440_2995 [Erwinia amylovora MR1]
MAKRPDKDNDEIIITLRFTADFYQVLTAKVGNRVSCNRATTDMGC